MSRNYTNKNVFCVLKLWLQDLNLCSFFPLFFLNVRQGHVYNFYTIFPSCVEIIWDVWQNSGLYGKQLLKKVILSLGFAGYSLFCIWGYISAQSVYVKYTC